MATRPERLMKHKENLKENNKHRKPPLQQRQTRPPLKSANVVTQGQLPRVAATVKQPPTVRPNNKPVKTGEKQHLTATIKCTVTEGGDRGRDKEDEMHTKVERPQGVDGNSIRSQLPPKQGRTLSRRELLVQWRRQKNEPNKTSQKPPSQTSLTSNPLKRKAVTTTEQAPPTVAGPRNDKKRPVAGTSSWKRPTLGLGSTLDRKLSMISGSRLSVVRPRPVSQLSTNAPAQAGRKLSKISGSRLSVARPRPVSQLSTKAPAQASQAQHISPSRRKSKRFVHVKASVDSNLTAIRSRSRMTCSPRLKLTVAPSRGANQRLSMLAHAKKTSVLGFNSKTSAACIPLQKEESMSQTSLTSNPLKRKAITTAPTNSWKRQTLCLGSTLDRKLSKISGSRLSVVRPRPVSQLSTNAPAQADRKLSMISGSRLSVARPRPVSQLSTNAPAQATQAQHISPSRRKSKRFVHVKACVDSNLTAIRSRSRMTCSPRLKLTVAPSCGANQRLPLPVRKTSVLGLNSKTSAGVLRTHTRMTCSPRLKQTVAPSRGVNARLSIPAHAQKTAVMGLKKTAVMGSKSRTSIMASHRSPRLQGVGSKAPGRHQVTDKGPVKFATPGRRESAWARSEVAPACTPLQKEESMREKLEAWLTSRGKTPSKYSHMMCFGHSLSHNVTTRTPASCHRHKKQSRVTPGKSDRRRTFSLPDSPMVTDPTPVMDEMTDGLMVDECHPPESDTLDGVLSECLQLLQESDCPPGLVQGWLREIGRVPRALGHAKFWIVKAAMAEESGESNDAVVDIFEEAFRHKVEPPEEMALALKGFVERMAKRRENQAGADRKTEDVHEHIFESSAVKYCMTNTTVFFKRVRSRLDTSPRRFTPHAMITPVRRSTRKSHAVLPIMLQEHDTMFDALEEVPEDLRPCTLFRPNRALETALKDSGET